MMRYSPSTTSVSFCRFSFMLEFFIVSDNFFSGPKIIKIIMEPTRIIMSSKNPRMGSMSGMMSNGKMT